MKLLRCFDILDRFIGHVIMIVILLTVLSVLAFCGFLNWQTKHRIAEDPSCFTSEKILMRIGGHVLAIPRKYKPHMFSEDNTILKLSCHKPGDPPIETSGVAFSASMILPGYQFGDKRNTTYEAFSLQLGIFYQAGFQDKYSEIKKQLDKESLKLEDLPKENNFYIFKDNSNKYAKYYISADSNFITPKGNPMVVECSPSGGSGGKYNNCAASYILKNGLGIGIDQANSYFVTLEDWPNFYRVVQNFVEGLEIKS